MLWSYLPLLKNYPVILCRVKTIHNSDFNATVASGGDLFKAHTLIYLKNPKGNLNLEFNC